MELEIHALPSRSEVLIPIRNASHHPRQSEMLSIELVKVVVLARNARKPANLIESVTTPRVYAMTEHTEHHSTKSCFKNSICDFSSEKLSSQGTQESIRLAASPRSRQRDLRIRGQSPRDLTGIASSEEDA